MQEPTILRIPTSQHSQMINITRQVQEVVKESGVKEGLCVVFSPHTTAGITINENADPDVQRDFLMEFDRIVPWEDGYLHMEGNSAAHLKTTMTNPSQTIIITRGKLMMGIWQGIYFCEYDGPRSRTCYVKVIEG